MAADLLGSMRVEIVGDNSQLDRSIDQSETKAKGFSKLLKKLFTGIAFVAVAKGIAKVSTALITAASDAQETKDKFGVVFSSVSDDARDAADRIKTEFRLSDETVERFLSGVGDITTGLGATGKEALTAAEQITKLGLDISSLSNLDAEQSVKALTSLFTGEREAAKALGIVINDTNLKAYAEDMGKIFKELTPLEKGFLSLELATQQSSLAIGNAALTAGSYANTAKAATESTKDLKAAIGENLLPAATQSLQIFSSLTTKLTEYVKEHNKLRELLDKFENDTDTAQDRVDLTEREIAATQKLYDENLKILTLRQGTAQSLQDEEAIDALFEKASLLNTELRAKQRLLETLKEEAAAEKEVTDALKAKEAEVARLAAVQLDLASTLETRRKAALSDDDLAIDSIQRQIDKWSQFRDIIGVQELLNDLIEERNELIADNSESVEENLIVSTDATDKLNALLVDQAREHGLLKDSIIEDNETVKASFEDTWKSYGTLALSTLSAIDTYASAIAERDLQRLKDSGASQEELDEKKKELEIKAAKRKKLITLFEITLSTASAIAEAIPNWPVVIATAAVGTAQTILAAATPIPTFAKGGIVAGNSFVGDKIPTLQNSGEMDIPMKEQAALWEFIKGGSNGSTGGQMIHNTVNLDGKTIIDFITKASASGKLITSARSVK